MYYKSDVSCLWAQHHVSQTSPTAVALNPMVGRRRGAHRDRRRQLDNKGRRVANSIRTPLTCPRNKRERERKIATPQLGCFAVRAVRVYECRVAPHACNYTSKGYSTARHMCADAWGARGAAAAASAAPRAPNTPQLGETSMSKIPRTHAGNGRRHPEIALSPPRCARLTRKCGVYNERSLGSQAQDMGSALPRRRHAA